MMRSQDLSSKAILRHSRPVRGGLGSPLRQTRMREPKFRHELPLREMSPPAELRRVRSRSCRGAETTGCRSVFQ